MLKKGISRRRFIQGTAAAGAALASVSSLSSFRLMAESGETASGSLGVTYSQNWCEMCFWKCGLTARTVNGRVEKLEGQPDCPANNGKLCAKGNSGVFQLYDKDRLKTPLIRTGERGSGEFRKATWEEALQYVADNTSKLVDTYGEETVTLFAHGSGEHSFIELMHIIGTPNVCIPSYAQCLGSREIGWALTYGKPCGGKEPVDSVNAKCIMLLGRNIVEALHVGELQDFIEGVHRGAHVIYVDPRYNKTAAKANQFMMIKPGTDSALLMGMIHHILYKGLYNKGFTDWYTSGINELAQQVRETSPAWASKITEIPEEEIIEAAEQLAKAAPHCYIHPGRRVTRYGNDTQFVRLIAILNALMGNWEQPGGIYKTIPFKIENKPHMVHFEKHGGERADGAGTEFPLAPKNLGLANKLMEAIAEQSTDLKAMFIYGCNPMHHHGDSSVVYKAIEQSELIVTCDIYMTDMALYSDVILPESTYLERYDPAITQARKSGYLQLREPATEPVHDTMGGWEMAEKLCHAMGYDNHFMKIPEYNREMFKAAGTTEEYMKEHGVYVGATGDPFPAFNGEDPTFRTPSGSAELYSNIMENFGYDPLPSYEKVPTPGTGEYRILFGRLSFHTHARTQNNAWLLALHHSEVELWINTEEALKLGIADGMKVRVVKGDKKSGPCTAKVVDYIHPEAIFVPHGFGHESEWLTRIAGVGARDADFTSNDTDPISGGAGFHNGFVKVEKV
ncbi:molybdopterin-containing oxidoreductase family protein [Limisalsivibrio acetivorans]|uniref:molybdopterin-containing oxidoreductase family protein n=1 Tax=Limisalsivibrio acetivorans TaxID=1304888 RepID=UPI0003B7638D|nr:molybdopterin-dependent oxidoreductase [Limisalsivibrio acetivorans]